MLFAGLGGEVTLQNAPGKHAVFCCMACAHFMSGYLHSTHTVVFNSRFFNLPTSRESDPPVSN